MKILVLGANGQVGSHLRLVLREATFWTRQDVDLVRAAELEKAVLTAQPEVIINVAAYTAVDRAEQEPGLAWAINAEAPAALARAADRLGALLVHLSTDYVFDGNSRRSYESTDPVNPINVYGRTKLGGELAIASVCSRYWILRTSWIFSEHGANFVNTMLRLANERDSLNVVDDQSGIPSYAGDLASVICELVSDLDDAHSLPFGIHHISGGPTTTWYEFAQEIFRSAHAQGIIARKPLVTPITTAEYPTAAKRPRYSVLASSEVLEEHVVTIADWTKGLDEMLGKIQGF